MRKTKKILSIILCSLLISCNTVVGSYVSTEADFIDDILHVASDSKFLKDHHGDIIDYGTCEDSSGNISTIQYYYFEDKTLYIRGSETIRKAPDSAKDATSVYFEKNIIGVESDAFKDYSQLTHIHYSSDWKLEANAFVNCPIQRVYTHLDYNGYIPEAYSAEDEITYINCDNAYTIKGTHVVDAGLNTSYESDCNELTIPDKITHIDDNAIKRDPGIVTVTFPESLTYIGTNNLTDCYGLKTINASSSIEYIKGSIGSNSPWFEEQKQNNPYIIVGKVLMSAGNITKTTDTAVIPEGIETIAPSAFLFSGIEKVSFPSTLKTIGEMAFYGSSLTEVTIPDNVTTIKSHAFANCSDLNTVSIPSKLPSLAADAFNSTPWKYSSVSTNTVVNGVLISYGEKGKTITVPEGTTSINAGYCGSGKLVNIIIPDSVTQISTETAADISRPLIINGNYGSYAEQYAQENDFAFAPVNDQFDFSAHGIVKTHGKCNDTTAWILFTDGTLFYYGYNTSDGKIEPGILSDDSSLLQSVKTIVADSTISTIEKNSFTAFENVDILLLSDKTKNISDSLFGNIPSSFIIAGNDSSMASSLAKANGCYYINTDEGFDFDSHGEITFIQEYGSDVYLLYFADNTLFVYGNGKMYDADSCTDEEKAFYDDFFNKLKEEKKLYANALFLDSSITEIPTKAFNNSLCAYVTSLHLSPTLTYIGPTSFCGISDADGLILPETVTHISDSAFESCSFTKIDLSKSKITSIPTSCFCNTKNVEEIILPQTLEHIGRLAFDDSDVLKITLPDSVKYIDEYAFRDCSRLTEIILPSSLECIGDLAFEDSLALTNIDFSKATNISEVGYYAFKRTPWLDGRKEENPLVIEQNIVIDGHFCDGEVTIPEGVTIIAGGAFSPYFSDFHPSQSTGIITKVNLPSTLKRIEKGAFRALRYLKEIDLPEGLISIGDYAFYGCKSAYTTFPDSLEFVGRDIFQMTDFKGNIMPDDVGLKLMYYSCSNHFVFATTQNIGPTIIFPDNTPITALGSHCIQGRNAKRIYLPATITTINSCAFKYCTELTTLTVYGNITSLGEDLFYDDSTLKLISAPKGSPLETYALEHNIPFEALDETAWYPETIYGDVNFNGKLDLNDVSMMLRFALYIEIPDPLQTYYGCGQASAITLNDVVRVLRRTLRIE